MSRLRGKSGDAKCDASYPRGNDAFVANTVQNDSPRSGGDIAARRCGRGTEPRLGRTLAAIVTRGPGTVTIEKIAASGDFTQSNDCPKSIAAGASCIITVIFKPSATGIRSGSVSILDLLHSSPQILSLAGLGLEN